MAEAESKTAPQAAPSLLQSFRPLWGYTKLTIGWGEIQASSSSHRQPVELLQHLRCSAQAIDGLCHVSGRWLDTLPVISGTFSGGRFPLIRLHVLKWSPGPKYLRSRRQQDWAPTYHQHNFRTLRRPCPEWDPDCTHSLSRPMLFNIASPRLVPKGITGASLEDFQCGWLHSQAQAPCSAARALRRMPANRSRPIPFEFARRNSPGIESS